jgi:hypothetical protein
MAFVPVRPVCEARDLRANRLYSLKSFDQIAALGHWREGFAGKRIRATPIRIWLFGLYRRGQAAYFRAFRDEDGHVTRTTRRRRGHDERCARRLFCDARLGARLDVVEAAVGATSGPSIRIRPAGSRCAHDAGPELYDALRYLGAHGKPGGDHHQDRLHPADDSDQHRRAGRAFVLGKSAAHSGTEPGAGRVAGGSAAARASHQTQAA